MDQPSPPLTPSTSSPAPRRGVLDWIEWLGNKLPEPALLFVCLAVIVVIVSGIGSALGWSVQPVQPRVVMIDKLDAAGNPISSPDGTVQLERLLDEHGMPVVELVNVGSPIQPRSLLTGDGVYWALSSMLRNFTALPALGLVFVAMLGIGLAEKFGFFSALMRFLATVTPAKLLTPTIVLLGANSSVASDAGYIILPPLAAALYHAVGRHPVAGLAAAFAGVSGGFGAGFFPTGGDGALAGFAQDAARVIDPQYTVSIVHNLFFKSGSVLIITLAGWAVTDLLVEPRLQRTLPTGAMNTGEASIIGTMTLTSKEKSALGAAMAVMVLVFAVFASMILLQGAPLHGPGQPTLPDGRVLLSQSVLIEPPVATADDPAALPPGAAAAPANNVLARTPLVITETGAARLVESPQDRWHHVIVPMVFLCFLLPGMTYGFITGTMRSQKDFIEGLYHGIRSIVPVLAIAFFMGQFVAYFGYTRLDRMLAYSGGSLLVSADLPIPLLLALFVVLVIFGDFAISGMLSKFGILAPIFVPMFMMVGISPELTTAAYRIGDSVVNIVTPLNSYLLIILVVLQKYKNGAGLGSLISLMLPYSVVFGIVWTGFLLAWYASGVAVGPDSPLHYVPQ